MNQYAETSRTPGTDAPVDGPSLVDAVLEGGPADFPAPWRRRRVEAATEVVKVCFNGGYEHFSRAAGDRGVVFRWTGRTRIAE